MVASLNCLCQAATGNWLVSRLERRRKRSSIRAGADAWEKERGRGFEFRAESFEKGTVSCFREYLGFRIRAGEDSVVGQGLVDASDDPGVGGQQAVLGSPLGGGNQAVDRFQIQGHLLLVDLVNNPAAQMGAFENLVDVAFSFSSPDSAVDMVQKGVELEKATLGLAVLEPLAGPAHFFLKVLLMAKKGGEAGAVLLTESSKGSVFGQEGLGLFGKLHTVMEMVLYVVRGAKNGEDFKLFLQASREFTRIISLMHKMAAQLNLDPEFIYHLMASPQWDLQEDSLLPHAIQAMSDTRHTLKVNLFAPCPEPEPEPAPEPALSSPRETQNSKLETLTAEPGPNPLPEVSASLARQPLNKPETGARPPAT